MKKKIFGLFVLVAVAIFAFFYFSGDKPEDVAGTYKNVGAFPDTAVILNANGTYDASTIEAGLAELDGKGTYEISGSSIHLIDSNSNDSEALQKKDNYYYIDGTAGIFYFETDEDYGQTISFDENGRSNQMFLAFYNSISNSSWDVLQLTFNDDGTFNLSDYSRTMYEITSEKYNVNGTYTVDNDIIHLNYNGSDHIMLIIDDKIYFNVFERIQ